MTDLNEIHARRETCQHEYAIIDAWARDFGGRRLPGQHVCRDCLIPMDLSTKPPTVWVSDND